MGCSHKEQALPAPCRNEDLYHEESRQNLLSGSRNHNHNHSTSQLNAGEPSLVSKDNDKNTVISLREIGEGKVSVKTLEEAAINKFRKQQEEVVDVEDLEDINDVLIFIRCLDTYLQFIKYVFLGGA